MLETFKIVELAAQAVACIHLNVPATQIQTVMGPGIQELYAVLKEQGRVKSGTIRPMRAAQTVYQGGYEGLGNAWGEFLKQVGAAGHKTAPDLLETYLRGPETGAAPAEWRTHLTRPLE